MFIHLSVCLCPLNIQPVVVVRGLKRQQVVALTNFVGCFFSCSVLLLFFSPSALNDLAGPSAGPLARKAYSYSYCMSVCVYILYIYVYIHTHTYIHKYIHIHSIYIWIYSYLFICTFIYESDIWFINNFENCCVKGLSSPQFLCCITLP